MHLFIDNDIGIQSLINDIFIPIDNFMINAKNKIFNNMNDEIKYFPILKNKKIKLKFNNSSIFISDKSDKIIHKKIDNENIKDLSKFITNQTKIKLTIDISKIWKSTTNYGILLTCKDIIILNNTATTTTINNDEKIFINL
jgi:hypothetical protein